VTAFLLDYGLFFAKVATVVLALIIVLGFIFSRRDDDVSDEGSINVRKLNDHLEQLRDSLRDALLDEDQLKREIKAKKVKDKADRKTRKKEAKLAKKRLGKNQPWHVRVTKLSYVSKARAGWYTATA